MIIASPEYLVDPSSVPLTENSPRSSSFSRQAVEFLSCFADRNGMSVRRLEEYPEPVNLVVHK
jgi:hypothetical protein